MGTESRPFVAREPNDHAGKRRGFRGHRSPPSGHINQIYLMGHDRHQLNAPVLTAFPVTTDH